MQSLPLLCPADLVPLMHAGFNNFCTACRHCSQAAESSHTSAEHFAWAACPFQRNACGISPTQQVDSQTQTRNVELNCVASGAPPYESKFAGRPATAQNSSATLGSRSALHRRDPISTSGSSNKACKAQQPSRTKALTENIFSAVSSSNNGHTFSVRGLLGSSTVKSLLILGFSRTG